MLRVIHLSSVPSKLFSSVNQNHKEVATGKPTWLPFLPYDVDVDGEFWGISPGPARYGKTGGICILIRLQQKVLEGIFEST